jgi:hypothetical protein
MHLSHIMRVGIWLLALVIAAVCTLEDGVLIGSRFYKEVTATLRNQRWDLSLPPETVAKEVGIPFRTLLAWEQDGTLRDPATLYRWSEALGFFCPPNTALVRVLDVSPELLRVLKQNPDELRRLSADQFEGFIANRLDRMGYKVALTGPTTRKDGGIDIIAVPKVMTVGSFVLAAQVKHHQGDQRVGREAVDRLASWNGPFRLGMVVTNTKFTKDAVWAAAQERNKDFIRLRDFIDLKGWLQDQYGSPEDWREIPDRIELAPGVVVEIPKARLYGADGELLGGGKDS